MKSRWLTRVYLRTAAAMMAHAIRAQHRLSRLMWLHAAADSMEKAIRFQKDTHGHGSELSGSAVERD